MLGEFVAVAYINLFFFFWWDVAPNKMPFDGPYIDVFVMDGWMVWCAETRCWL